MARATKQGRAWAGAGPGVSPARRRPARLPSRTFVLGAGALQHCAAARAEAVCPGCIRFVLGCGAGLHRERGVAAAREGKRFRELRSGQPGTLQLWGLTLHPPSCASAAPCKPTRPPASLGGGVGVWLPGRGPHGLPLPARAPGGQRGIACLPGGGGQSQKRHVPSVVVFRLAEPAPGLAIHCSAGLGGAGRRAGNG